MVFWVAVWFLRCSEWLLGRCYAGFFLVAKVDMLFMVAKVFWVIAEALLRSCHGVLGCILVSKVF